MQLKLWTRDFGSFVLARELLKSGNPWHLELFVQQREQPSQKDFLSPLDIWPLAIEDILKNVTRFGRIGIFVDRKSKKAFNFFSQFDIKRLAYTPKEKKRAEKTPRLDIFSTQLLVEMANEGLEDSVEFRRFIRKYTRRAKNHHCDTIFFPDSILGGDKARKIIQQAAGTQMKCVFVSDYLLDFLATEKKNTKKEERKITIHTKDDLLFTHKRAEQIMRTKLKKESIIDN